MRPGVNVTTKDNAPPSTIPTDVGTCFMVGVTEGGSVAPTTRNLVQNMDEYKANYAPSGRSYIAGLTMYDSTDLFFAQGGNRLYIGRVLGAAAAAAAVDLTDNASVAALHVVVRGAGEWGNNIRIVVDDHSSDPTIAAGLFRLTIVNRVTSEVIDVSPDLADAFAAINWGIGTIVQISAGPSVNDPFPANYDLVGGTNDITNINDASWQAGFDSLSYTLGPGILTVPGATSGSIYDMAAEAARRDLRVAFLDGPDTPTSNTTITSAKSVNDTSNAHSRFSGMFVPWLIVPGVIPGTVRKIPPSPVVAGIFARNMAGGYSANQPAAGELGRLSLVIALTQTYTDAERQNMNNNGVNVIKDVYGVNKVYGWRTTADPVLDKRWLNLSNSILHRQIVALCNSVGERFVFRQIDGQGRLIGEFGAALAGEVCAPLFDGGSLFGDSPSEAFKVDVGPSVNTTATIANNELHAVISVRMAPFGEEVDIAIVKYLVSETIPVA